MCRPVCLLSVFPSQDSPRQDSTPHLVLETLQRQRENPAYYPSFEERVAIDIAAVTCTVVEMCCVKQLRTALSSPAGLLERIGIIRKLLGSGQLRLPRCVGMHDVRD